MNAFGLVWSQDKRVYTHAGLHEAAFSGSLLFVLVDVRPFPARMPLAYLWGIEVEYRTLLLSPLRVCAPLTKPALSLYFARELDTAGAGDGQQLGRRGWQPAAVSRAVGVEDGVQDHEQRHGWRRGQPKRRAGGACGRTGRRLEICTVFAPPSMARNLEQLACMLLRHYLNALDSTYY